MPGVSRVKSRTAGTEASVGFDSPVGQPLAEAKLAAPLPRRTLVDRPRIRGALDASDPGASVLVAAPAGYGKTTAVRAWCASRTPPVAWVRLDAGDNDPVRFWTYVATAVDRIRPGLGRRSLQRLNVLGASIEGAVDELANALTGFGEELVIVLDDLQSVTSTDCMAALDHAIEDFPASVRLVMMSRTDPALRLPQLRASGRLTELRASELAFTTAEAFELIVEREGIDLLAADVELLHEWTEGWPAALFLAALWLRSVDDPREAVREFGGDHRFIADYLSAEVIASLDEDTRAFLLRASVLGQFTAELCDAALGRNDSELYLARLRRANPFLDRLEHGGWYRVHSLFAEFAGYQLAALDPGAAAHIHRRASRWLWSRGLSGPAMEHAAAARDYGLVAEFLVESYLSLVTAGRIRTLLRWARMLDDEQIVEHPEIAASSATAATMLGHADLERRRYLELAGRAEREHPDRVTPYVRATVDLVRAAALDGDVGRAVEAGRCAVDLAQAEVDVAVVAALGSYARALYFAGELDDAWAAAMRAIEHPDIEHRPPGHAFARSTLALVAVDRGWSSVARGHAERAKSIVSDLGITRTWLGANAGVALGCVFAGEGNLAEAERELASAEHLFRDEVFTVHHAWLLVLLAGVRCRRGRLVQAEAALRSARSAIETFTDAGRVSALASEVEQELERALGRASLGVCLERPSEAELAVLRLLNTDLSVRQIGGELFISSNTVRSHTRAIYRKLGVNSRAAAIARAELQGLLRQAETSM